MAITPEEFRAHANSLDVLSASGSFERLYPLEELLVLMLKCLLPLTDIYIFLDPDVTLSGWLGPCVEPHGRAVEDLARGRHRSAIARVRHRSAIGLGTGGLGCDGGVIDRLMLPISLSVAPLVGAVCGVSTSFGDLAMELRKVRVRVSVMLKAEVRVESKVRVRVRARVI